MLISLSIKNFALVESAEVAFSSGLNVISGESGSGKSILIGAIFVLLGGRSDRECIREGEKKCEIEAVLRVGNDLRVRTDAFLKEYDIEDCGGEIIIRRVLSENSARSYVNGTLVPLKAVRELGAMFFDFNRPDDELSLNSQSRQLELLDKSGGVDLNDYRSAFCRVKALRYELAEFDSHLPDADELDEARELVDGIEKYGFTEDEEDELVNRHKMLSNARELINISSRASAILSGEENSVTEVFAAVMRELYSLDKLADGALEKLLEEGENVNGALNSLQNSLDTFASKLELDGESLQEIEDRLDALYRLKRRFGPSVQELFEHYNKAKDILAKSENYSLCRRELQDKLSAAENLLAAEGAKLTAIRKKAASELEVHLLQELESLGFKKCCFEWSFKTVEFSESGADELDILFSANSGERVLPLRKIASSGERSRLFLAIKNVLARVDDIPVVIFDEIDANIGGETANKVGAALHELGKYRQIITISHLAQIGCMADAHWQVAKFVREDGRTVSNALLLDGEKRIQELARMLGNAEGATDYAASMLQCADLLK